MHKCLGRFVGGLIVLLTLQARGVEPVPVRLIPWPKEIQIKDGSFELKPSARIVAASKELKPLAAVLRGDIRNFAGLTLETADGEGQAGDIILKIDPALAAEGRYFPHAVTIGDKVEIRGVDYGAVVHGTSVLLQLLAPAQRPALLPCLSLSDWSPAEYPGMMIDVARQRNSLSDLRDGVNLCRFYKVRYLHLHLNDMESFTFPSKLFPKLGTHNGAAFGTPKIDVYPRDQFEEFLRYADDRGVAVVPELETVFHTGAMMGDMPEELGGPGVLNMVSEKMYGVLEPLIEEMCDVFKSSPYFHIGCDEASVGGLANMPTYKEYTEKHKLADPNAVFSYHIERLSEVIAKKGKRTIVWQDCPLPRKNKPIVMVWRIDYDNGPTPQLIRDGYPCIQVTWTPSIWSPVKEGYDWHPFNDQVQPGKLAVGSQMVLWEADGTCIVPGMRLKVSPRQERTYGYNANRSYEDFCANLLETDLRFDTLLSGINGYDTGMDQTLAQFLKAGGGGVAPPRYIFDETSTVTLKTPVEKGQIRYTWDKSEPTATSTLYTAPIVLSKLEGLKIQLRARVFDEAGKPVASVWSRLYKRTKPKHLIGVAPISAITVDGKPLPFKPATLTYDITVTLDDDLLTGNPNGVARVPKVDVTFVKELADVTVTPATAVPGSTKILMKPLDDDDRPVTYTIKFTIALPKEPSTSLTP